MYGETIKLWEKEEYSYPLACGFVPNMVSYIHEEKTERPCMIIVPGGGYNFVSSSEGEIVAKKFYEKGYNAFVLTYTTDLTMTKPLRRQPMKDLSRAIRMLRQNPERYKINPDQIVVCGFSAGGHLCASLCVHYEDVKEEHHVYKKYSNRPNAAILAYPVITSGKYAHKGSFVTLLGKQASKKELSYMSLEKHVTKHTPPCFLWQTQDDASVPVENSYLFAEACKKHKVPFAHHVFSEGVHGLSLADEVWAGGEVGGTYTKDQIVKMADAIQKEEIELSEAAKKVVTDYLEESKRAKDREPNPEAAIWPELAAGWLKKILS